MKTLKWSILVVIATSFIVGLGVLAWSKPPMAFKIMCPQGWHNKPNSGPGVVACIPDEPTMSCPKGWEYYFNGCEVGCKKASDIPR